MSSKMARGTKFPPVASLRLSLQEQFPFPLPDVDVFQDARRGVFIDYRAHEVFRVLARPEEDALRRRLQARDQHRVVFLQHDQPRTRRTLLALVVESRREDAETALSKSASESTITAFFPPSSATTPFMPCAPSTGLAASSMRRRPTSLLPVNAMKSTSGCVARRPPIDSPAPGRKSRTPGTKPRRVKYFHQHRPGCRRSRGGFVHDRVSGDDGGRNHAHGNGERKIPWSDNAPDPPRFVEQNARLPGNVSHPPGRSHASPVVFQEIYRLADVSVRVAPTLPHLEDLQGRQVEAHPPGRLGGPEKAFGALPGLACPRRGKGLPRGPYRRLRLGDPPGGDHPHHLFRIVGIGRENFLLRPDPGAAHADRDPDRKIPPRFDQRLCKALPIFTDRPIEGRFVPDPSAPDGGASPPSFTTFRPSRDA